MNVIQSASALSKAKETAPPDAASLLNQYKEIPRVELSLDDFEVYALKRLKVLRKIEQLKMLKVPADVIRQKLNQVIAQEGLSGALDTLSHFILRLSYCQSEELRRWFLQQESQLFLHRLQQLSASQWTAQFEDLKPISRREKDALQSQLLLLMNPTEFATTAFYKVPFAQALDLVATRQCYVHAGYAFVPQAKIHSILVTKFRSDLSRQLALLSGAGSFRNNEDPEAVRIYPLLKNLNSCLVNREPSEDTAALGSEQLTAATVDPLTRNMPLCMQQLQEGMVKDKKLRHWGRLQYGLFLKGAGLSLDDAILYFQRHFTLVTGEQFQKQYAYNIRHMYGKEGKRATYTAYSCAKIINGNAPASVGDHHGCPYRHYDADHLASTLMKLKIGTPGDRSTILNLKKSHQYQLACQKHFDVMHPDAASSNTNLDNVGNHPNAWFRASVEYKNNNSDESKKE